MSKIFYRLQMKDGRDGETVTDHMLSINRITAHEDYGGEEFVNLKKGDIVIVQKSAYPVAMVIVQDKIAEDLLDEKSLGVDFSVEILSWFKDIDKKDAEIASLWGYFPFTKTFSSLNSGNSTYTKVLRWYNILISSKMINELTDLLSFKFQIILQGPPGTGKTYTAKDIAESMICGSVSADKEIQKTNLVKSDQYSLIQFHPSYSYEDFVRGITAKSNGNSIEYKTVNKRLCELADKANKNLVDSKKPSEQLSKERWLDEKFLLFVNSVIGQIESKGKIKLTEGKSIDSVDEEEDRFVSGQNYYLYFNQIKKLYLYNIDSQKELEGNENFQAHVKWRTSYYFPILHKFRSFLNGENPPSSGEIKVEKRNYVLILDEINRANLPSVLGELIYALEYRDEPVDGMYEIEGERELVLPSNLFIIGTMNTADRSVGHIDYAIRRRFAFVHVPPSANVIDEVIKDTSLNAKAKALYNAVENLFMEKNTDNETYTYLSSDFKPEEVQLGHSYFLADSEEHLKLKLEYEIKPILDEYLKDGILLGTAKPIIDGLS